MHGDSCKAKATQHQKVIAIDGPAAAGKSTVARMLADRLGALLFDTGALYRAVALQTLREGIEPGNAEKISRLARESSMQILPPSTADGRTFDVLLNGEDVTWETRDSGVGAIVSQIAEHFDVRSALLPLQRQIAAEGPVVMVGRDIGTIVVPEAGLKIYLDAAPEERAKRRFHELTARGGKESIEEVVRETRARDLIDTSRTLAPLRVAPDAIQIDTDQLSVEDVVDQIELSARAKIGPDGFPLWPK